MRIKQRKSVPWRRFGYVILIIIKFCELLLWISPRIINALRSCIKHSKEGFIRYLNTSKLVKKTRLCPVFSTHFSEFGWNTLPCVWFILHTMNKPLLITIKTYWVIQWIVLSTLWSTATWWVVLFPLGKLANVPFPSNYTAMKLMGQGYNYV